MRAQLIFLAVCATIVICQRRSGDCPPKPIIQVCNMTCYADVYCSGDQKCCRTACGGTTCLDPVTKRQPGSYRTKAGYCPAVPSGAWVCSNRCAVDGDCGSGIKKCCKNRCGAMACTFPVANPF